MNRELIKERFKKIDFTSATPGTILLFVFFVVIAVVFDMYWYVVLPLPLYIVLVIIFALIFIPLTFFKFDYSKKINLCPEINTFVDATKQNYPITQKWNSDGYFTFEKSNVNEIKNIKKSYTIRGLEIYQRIDVNRNNSVFQEAFQNISSRHIIPDFQTFKNTLESLKRDTDMKLMMYMIGIGIMIFIICIGLVVLIRAKVI